MDNPSSFLRETMVLIPALNEAACISSTVEMWLALKPCAVRVVDNASNDDTAAIAQASGAEVVFEPERGYGAAAWRGLQEVPNEIRWVLFSSADGSDRLSLPELAAWQEAVEHGNDLIVGDRVTFPASRAQLKRIQRFGNWITCKGIQLGWGRSFAEMGSLRLVHYKRLMGLDLQDRAFGWNVEMQVRAIEQGWKIAELPVHYYPRRAGQSKISGNAAGSIKAGVGILRMLGFLWLLRTGRGARPAPVLHAE